MSNALEVRKIVSKIQRVEPDVIELFKGLYSGIILDALGKHGAMSVDIGSLSPGMTVCGPAVTSLGPDLTVRRMAIDLAQSGDVLVVAAGGIRDYSCFGDGTARRMLVKGMPGAVIDGSTRDAAGLRRIPFATFSLGITARNYHYPSSGDHGAVNVPVVCGGVLVTPGDLIFGDDDGVVVIPRGLARAVGTAAAATLRAENEQRDSWSTYPPFDLGDELRDRGYVFE